MSFVPVEASALYDEHLEFASCGFDFSALRTLLSNTMQRGDTSRASQRAEPRQLFDIDLSTIDDPHVVGSAAFVAARDGTLHGFTSWFDATLVPGGNALESRATHDALAACVPAARNTDRGRAHGMTITLCVDSYDATTWRWRGAAGTTPFDQTTGFAVAPCVK